METSRRALSSLRDACEPSLWHPCRLPRGGHAARASVRPHSGRQDHPPRARVNDARCRSDPRCLPSSKDRRPAAPSRAPGSGLRLHRDLAVAMRTINAFSPPPTLSSLWELGSRPRAPLPAGTRFSEPRRCVADFCNHSSTRGHTQRAFSTRTRVELSPRYWPAPTDAGCVGLRGALPHRGPASHDPRAPAFARRAPLAWTGRIVGRGARARIRTVFDDFVRVPPRSAPSTRVAGSIRREVWSPSRLVAPAKILLRVPPREGQHRRENQGAFCRAGTLTRSEDCSAVRAWIGAPSRHLRRGIAPGLSRPCHPFCSAFH